MKKTIEKLINIFENETDEIKDYKFKKKEVYPNSGHGIQYYWLCYKKMRINIVISRHRDIEIRGDDYYIIVPNFFEFKKKFLYRKLTKLIKQFLIK